MRRRYYGAVRHRRSPLGGRESHCNPPRPLGRAGGVSRNPDSESPGQEGSWNPGSFPLRFAGRLRQESFGSKLFPLFAPPPAPLQFPSSFNLLLACHLASSHCQPIQRKKEPDSNRPAAPSGSHTSTRRSSINGTRTHRQRESPPGGFRFASPQALQERVKKVSIARQSLKAASTS
jgi:hypothetical protein